MEKPQIQHTDKVADKSVAVQRRVSPRTTETKHRIFKLTVNICKQQSFKLIDLAHEITGVKVAQKTWHKLLDDASTKEAVADDTANSNTNITSRVSQTTLSDFSMNLEEPSPTEIDDQTRSMDSHAIQCEQDRDGTTQFDTLSESTLVQGPGVNQRIERQHSKFEIKQVNVTDTSHFVISTIDHGAQVDHRKTGKGKSKHTGKGKGNHVDVVETEQPQPSETAPTVLAIVGGDADESMDMVRPEAEAWRLIQSIRAEL